MANKINPKLRARLEAQSSPETKALIEKAAYLQGLSLNDFIVSTVQAEAIRVIQEHQTLKLSQEDSVAFANSILNPPQLNDKIKSAFSQYKDVIKN
ncbi:DUF1778 domain-containing protein [Laspinema sp. A4]|uniref:type II toxin-antitoxin system TacA family antitoxin n=1 Tax=Laspinema sp. D2d TaxID=2953686 RepID=UPI0021BB2191|nr:DUF1778 domain-containing protein [Laspinema sp. D2d]MCT7983463.1 DUF1778 domain-containing protein [Laspinema sp. D2d]